MTIEALIPNLAAKSRLSLTFLSLKSVSYASIKRAETSFFASIIQNIELFSPKNLVFNTEYCIFAARLRLNARPKIVKKAENNEFLQLKNMNDTEIKEWQTQSVKHKVAMVLIMDGVSFSYTEEDGIVFTAPECYVARLVRRLISCYRCSVRPKINEVK